MRTRPFSNGPEKTLRFFGKKTGPDSNQPGPVLVKIGNDPGNAVISGSASLLYP